MYARPRALTKRVRVHRALCVLTHTHTCVCARVRVYVSVIYVCVCVCQHIRVGGSHGKIPTDGQSGSVFIWACRFLCLRVGSRALAVQRHLLGPG